MTRSELVSILMSHGFEGVRDPEVLVALGQPGGEAFEVRFVPAEGLYEAHVLLVPAID